MPPKKDKKDLPDTAWRTIIESTPLNEDNWKVQVVIMEAAGSDQDRIYLNKFETFAAEEKRFVIKNICRTETIFMVNQLGGEKKIKDENLRVFEEGQSFLKDKKDIPSDIIALIIKHLILKMKEEYLFIKRQRLEVREGMRLESATMVNKAEVRGTVNASLPESPAAASPPKGKGKKGANDIPEMPKPEEGKKYDTQLRVRGEEWRDKIYVDDFPTDGPNLYVAVTGFVDPFLAMNLIKIGVPVSAVVQVRIDAANMKVPSTLFRATKRGQSQTEMLADKAMKFWEDLQALRITNPGSEDYKATAFIIFTPPYWEAENLSGNPDTIYDELCYLMYDVQDLTRQHLNYLDNMNIINVPENIEDERLNKCYNQQLDDLPLESVTFYSVMDSLLQAVCNSQDVRDGSSRTSLSSAVTLAKPRKSCTAEDEKIDKAETFVKEVFNTLCKTDANRKAYRLTYGEEYETHKSPTIINYGDFAKYSTFHLGNINLDNIVWSSLYCMPLHRLWDNQDRPHGELEAKINFHVNLLLSCFERNDIETAELNRLIHILACRKLYNNRSSLKKKHMASGTITEFKKVYLKRSKLAEPLTRTVSLHHSSDSRTPSFPSMTKSENSSNSSIKGDNESARIKFLFDCPDISELVSAAELANGTPINHMIDDFEYFEDFSGVSAFQILLDAFTKFNCVDYKYCEVTDCILLMFFNSHDKDGITRDLWRNHLVTPVCLQDFFDFVLEEQYDWIQTEEKIYDEAMELKSQSEYKVIVDPNALRSCIAEVEVASDLLMEGSLKHQEMVEKDEDNTTDSTMLSTKVSQKSTSPTSTEVDWKGKKPKTPSAKGRRQSFMQSQTASQSLTEVLPKPFLGYNLSERRVEVLGKDATYFSRDGTRIVCNYTMVIPTNIEFIVLNVVPGNNCNEFWIHKALGDSATPDIVDLCESFRITSKDQVLINIVKQTYKVPILETVTTAGPVSDDNLEDLFDTLCYYSLIVTWPNGLITESVYEQNSPRISHVKQYHLMPRSDLDETMRCVSLNGEVLIFKGNGNIDVLRPDGCIINIKKYSNRQVIPEVQEDLISDVSSEKSKKGKGKEKEKDKSSKSSNKSKVDEEEKPAEYEFFIEEFEYTDTSGLRQKWVNDIPRTIEKLLIRTATDYCQGEIFSRRMDGTYMLLNKDGVNVVTFPDQTRIISKFIIEDEEIYPEWTEDEMYLFEVVSSDDIVTDNTKSKASFSQKSYVISQASVASSFSTKKVEINLDVEEEEVPKALDRIDGYISVQMVYTIEHANFTTVTVNKANEIISVESPNNTEVIVDSHNNYKIILDNVTTATFDGENLHISYEACPECRSFTKCDIKIRPDTSASSLTKVQQHWMKMKDSFFKRVVVNYEGSIDLMDEPYSDESVHPEEMGLDEDNKETVEERQADGKSESSTISHGKCREMYLAKTIRFFVLERDLTCSELVHRALLELYNRECRWQPWCSINQYDTFGDQRGLLSVLTPVHLTESEKWLMDSKLAAKPKYLTYKDLKEDCGKGFYHWMRPYERFEPKPKKPDNALPPRLPRAFILRTLEQQWKEKYRETYKGAKELLIAILRYRQILETDSETLLYVPLVDMRPEEERRIDDAIQALAHRIYEDLKTRLAEDVQNRAKADITTKPLSVEEELSVQGEVLEEEQVDEMALLEEERQSLVKQVEELEPMSPNLKRYWHRRAEEYKEEQFYKYLLREGNVPPYFRNVLGGAIWWEMNNTATDAVTKAERKHMKCICAPEEASTSESAPPAFM